MKLAKIKQDKIDAIEIDLSHLQKNSSLSLITEAIFSNNYTKWLNNEKINGILKKKIDYAIDLRDYIYDNAKPIKTYYHMRRIYNCPLKMKNQVKKYIEIETVCKRCDYFVDLVPEINFLKEQYEMEMRDLEEKGEDTFLLPEKYGDKIYQEQGHLNCASHLANEFENKINNAS